MKVSAENLSSGLTILAALLFAAVFLAGCKTGSSQRLEATPTMIKNTATPIPSHTPSPSATPKPTMTRTRFPTPAALGDRPDPGEMFVPQGYRLAFSDEFDGNALDTEKWNTLAPWGVQFYADSNQKQAFVPSAVTIQDGVARFTAQPADGDPAAAGQPYLSGSFTSNRAFTYGYYEARIKVPAGKGLWPALWLTSSTRWPPEWDIFEIVGDVDYGFPHPITGGKCKWVEGAAGSDNMYILPDQYDVFHIYGFLWTETDIFWYVDGILTEHYAIDAAAGAGDAFWWNASLQVGGNWPGDPDSSTPFPAVMEVDYMRLYQK